MSRLIHKLAREIDIRPAKALLLSLFAVNFIVAVFDFNLMLKLIILTVLGCIFSFFINFPFKLLFRTKRPKLYKHQEMEYGFPSFHTQIAFTIATIYSFYIHLLLLPTFISAIFVGVSRLITGSHKFKDIMFGSIFGVLVGSAIILI